MTIPINPNDVLNLMRPTQPGHDGQYAAQAGESHRAGARDEQETQGQDGRNQAGWYHVQLQRLQALQEKVGRINGILSQVVDSLSQVMDRIRELKEELNTLRNENVKGLPSSVSIKTMPTTIGNPQAAQQYKDWRSEMALIFKAFKITDPEMKMVLVQRAIPTSSGASSILRMKLKKRQDLATETGLDKAGSLPFDVDSFLHDLEKEFLGDSASQDLRREFHHDFPKSGSQTHVEQWIVRSHNFLNGLSERMNLDIRDHPELTIFMDKFPFNIKKELSIYFRKARRSKKMLLGIKFYHWLQTLSEVLPRLVGESIQSTTVLA